MVDAHQPAAASAGDGGPGPAWARNRSTIILFLVAGLVCLLTLVWSLAYRMGHDTGQRSVLSHTDPGDAAIITGQPAPTPAPTPTQDPTTRASGPSTNGQANRSSTTPAAGGAASQPRTPAPTSGTMPAVAGPDPRKPGFNYLEVCILTWRDAEPAVRFLQGHNVRATAVPLGKQVDPAKPDPKDKFLVLIDQPFPSGEGFRASQNERNALVAEVRRLGKRWQSEFRGASDFAEPMWRLQRGK